MYFVYNLILLFFLPLILFFFFFFSTRGSIRGTLSQRFGRIDFSRLNPAARTIWIHVSSVGEARTAFELMRALRTRFDDSMNLVVSVITRGGYEVVAKEPMVDAVFFLPIDLPWILKKVFRQLNPVLLLVLETELWPNLFKSARKFGCKILIANARISPSSINRYRKFRSFMRRVLANVDRICVQNEIYFQRYLSIGAPEARLSIVGDIKEEQSARLPDTFPKKDVLAVLNWGDNPILAAASTHPGEEALLAEAFRELKSEFPKLKLILAPRHVHRAEEIVKLLEKQGFTWLRRSEHPKILSPVAEVILWDTFGELGRVFAVASLVFVGGSLLPIGGHSLLEPAAFGVPVLWGPHAFNFPLAEEKLLKWGGGLLVADKAALVRECRKLLTDDARRKAIGTSARDCVFSAKGSVARHLAWVVELVNQT
jgi:3-deoxy-D-manno-octulosonic-acid transferase